jgi:signal transduction histidine kinase/DNA-binding response OmpR family regulator/ligand-binding sensor domain-containing protein
MKNKLYPINIVFRWTILLCILFINISATRTSTAKIDKSYKYSVTYFSAKNGFEDALVNDIIQDKKGLLWFATWNGLYRFDGYNFENYKSNIKNKNGLTNDRILNIAEDKFGYIWILCYDYSAYRFNPYKESFEPILQSTYNQFQSIKVLPNGNTWLLKKDGSAIRAQTDPNNSKLILKSYAKRQNTLPNGNILTIFMDSKKREWILTDNGLYYIYNNKLYTLVQGSKKEKISFYSAIEDNGTLMFGANKGRIFKLKGECLNVKQLNTDNHIISILKLLQNTVYITNKNGFFISNIWQSSPKFISLNTLTQLKNKAILSAHISNNGLLWLTHPVSGVTLYDVCSQKLKYFEMKDELGQPLNTDTGFFTFKDRNGIIWVHPKGGGFSYFDSKNETLIPFNATDKAVKWESNDRCFSAFSDKQGNLWMSTQMDRLKRITFAQEKFSLYTPNKINMELPENEIRALFIDKKKRIWTGTRDQNISIYDNQQNLINRFKVGKVYAITEDSKNTYWISTKGQGLKRAIETSPGKFKIQQYCYNPQDKYSISNNNIYYAYEDNKKRIWIATYGGGLNIAEQRSNGSIRFINYRNTMKNYPINRFYKVRHITEDKWGRIWVSTTGGILIFNVNFKNPQEIKFHAIVKEQGNINSLSNNDAQMVQCRSDKKFFTITYGGGLDELIQTGYYSFKCKSFTKKNGLVSDIIYSMQEDKNKNLWLATGGGLVKFIVNKGQIQYPTEHLAYNLHFSEGVGATNGKQIFFGTNRGLLYFTPENIHKSNFVPRIFFSSICVNNKELTPQQNPSILTTDLDNIRKVILPPNNHTLKIIFSALDMTDTEYIKYAYMLEGFDKNYQLVENGHEANYTNLPPGHYRFHVKSTNSEGAWVANERVLPIDVQPTFNQTIWAKILYSIICLLLVISSVYVYLIFFKMKNKIKNEEYITQLKLKFFTDISHELRTPLTLICGPIEYILKNENISDKIKNILSTVKKNSDRMQRLIGDILDFNKLQNDKMKLKIQELDIVEFTKKITLYFDELAKEREIQLTFISNIPVCYLWFDASHIEKVIFNILSNAFKYTTNGKKIGVEIKDNDNAIYICISDEGIGIPKEKLKCIFDRYENLVQQDVNTTMSSGIGLSLANELVKMHHGNIIVESTIGKGSIFSIKLLKGRQHYPENTEYILSDMKEPLINNNIEDNEEIRNKENVKCMLIVEDNQELRVFIKQIFDKKFQVIEASNGEEGFEIAIKRLPDIILTDIMMPIKDGITMLQDLRNDIRTSHIPAIVLTAKSDLNNVIIGIQTGADDYITKPFSITYLQAKIEAIFAKRKLLQTYFCSNPLKGDDYNSENIPSISNKDHEFLEKLSHIMDQQMNNPELRIDNLVNYFDLSRTNFFCKLKSLTGLSPVLYIRDVRMHKAVELIKEKQYTIAEIAYMVGFNDPHYFSKTFKAFWKKNPTEFT